MASSPEQGAAAAPLRRVGRYQLERRLAVGGMAEVFVARRDGDGARVVLKLLLPQHARDPELAAMLADEARVTLALDHPGLVRVLELGAEGDERFLAMELVDGLPLARLLALRGAGSPLPIAVALHVAERVLEALDYIHGRRDESGRPLEIVHRDVTPGNVLLSTAGEVKLADFGIARHRLRAAARTRTGVIKGTLQYLAPEQLASAEEVDRRTDLYAVGLLLYEMLAGRPFIDAEREVDLLRVAQEPPWRPPSELRPEVEPALDRVVQSALRRFPEERYPSAQAFLAALRSAVPPAGVDARDVLAALMRELCGAPPPTATPVLPRRAGLGSAHVVSALLGAAAIWGSTWLVFRQCAAGGGRAADAGGAHDAMRAARVHAPSRAADAALAPAPDVRAVPDVAPRRATRPPKRVPLAPPERAPDARPSAPVAGVDGAQLARRLDAAVAALRARGILEEDLPAAVRERLARTRRQPARPAVEELERALGAASVGHALVERKLKRVDGLLRAAQGKRADVAALRERAAVALQEFMDGRHAAANRELNAILEQLAKR